MDTNELRKVAKAVYLATEERIADDLSARLLEAADEIDKLRVAVTLDTVRIDFLEQIMVQEGEFTKKCILRPSTTGRGYRLHETSIPEAVNTVREAIDNVMLYNKG